MGEPVIPTIATLPIAEPQVDAVTETVWLDWHDRRKARQRVIGDAGTELRLSLPRGTVLADGQLLYRDEDRQIVVRSRPQLLLKISSSSLIDCCRVAHHLGNWHRPIQIDADGTLWVEADRPIAEWLERSGIPFAQMEAPFEPNSIAHQH